MRASIRYPTVSHLVGAVSALWLCGAGSAWAGDGGSSLSTIQAIIGPLNGSSGFCKILNMNPCPQLPSVTQAVLEAAGLGLSPPEMVAAQNSIPAGSNVNAGNPAVVPLSAMDGTTIGTPFPLSAKTSPTLSGLLSTLTPLAFISSEKNNQGAAAVSSARVNQGAAAATQLYDPDADTFLYGVTASTIGFTAKPGGTIPDTLFLFYDGLQRTNSNFLRGQTVAKFLLPLTVLNVDSMGKVSERQVATTLKVIAPTTDCSASTVTGDFMGSGTPQTVPATAIALNCAVDFGPSPTSTQRHAIFEVAIPLLVTGTSGSPYNTDPAYFYSFLHSDPMTQQPLAGPINIGLYTAFTFFDDIFGTATPPANLGANGIAIGIAPAAGPFCTAVTCPPGSMPPPPPPGSIKFALCASLPPNGNGQALVPAVGAYYAIATDGETLLSAALPTLLSSTTSKSVCPPL